VSRRTVVAIAAALSAVVGLGVLAMGSPAERPDRPTVPPPHAAVAEPDVATPPDESTAPTAPGPTRTEAGVPMGFAHSIAGAEAAGAAFVRAGPVVAAMDEAAAAEAQRTMSTTANAERLVGELRDQRAALAEGFGPGPLRWWLAPLATKVRPDGPDAAEVTVWYVSVVAPAELAPYVDWRVSTRRLVWERDDWRVEAEHDAPGPRPATLPRPEPSAPAEFVAVLADFNTAGLSR